MHRAPLRRQLLGGAAALVPIGLLAPARAQVPQPAPPPAPGELRFGALFPLSGPLALPGDECFRGLELATEERNAAGGVALLRRHLDPAGASSPGSASGPEREERGEARSPAAGGGAGCGACARAGRQADRQEGGRAPAAGGEGGAKHPDASFFPVRQRRPERRRARQPTRGAE